MLLLLVRQLRSSVQLWAGVAVVTAATAAVTGFCASLVVTAGRTPGNPGLALYGISGSVTTLTAVAAFVVLSSVGDLTVALQRREHALWQLVGVRPGAVRTIVLAQLGVVALAGSAAGYLLGLPLRQAVADAVFSGSADLAGVRLSGGTTAGAVVVLAVTGLVLLSGWRPARRAARLTGVELLREASAPRLRMGPLRWVVAAGTLAAVVGIVASLPGRDPSAAETPLSLLPALLAGLLVATGPLFAARLLRRWTGLLPAGASGSWFLGRALAADALERSTAAINPLVVAVALTGGLWSAHGTVGRAVSARTGEAVAGLPAQGVVLLIGGPLLLAGLGAATTVAMSGRARERDAALVQAAGGTPGTVLAAACWEAVAHVGTATLLGAGAVLAGALAGGLALGVAPSVGAGAVAVSALAGLLLVLVATVVPTLSALRRDPVRVLAAE